MSEFFTAASSSTISSRSLEMSSAVSFAYLHAHAANKPAFTKEPRQRASLVVAHKQNVIRLHRVARVEGQRVLTQRTQTLQDRQVGAELAVMRRSPGISGQSVT